MVNLIESLIILRVKGELSKLKNHRFIYDSSAFEIIEVSDDFVIKASEVGSDYVNTIKFTDLKDNHIEDLYSTVSGLIDKKDCLVLGSI